MIAEGYIEFARVGQHKEMEGGLEEGTNRRKGPQRLKQCNLFAKHLYRNYSHYLFKKLFTLSLLLITLAVFSELDSSTQNSKPSCQL